MDVRDELGPLLDAHPLTAFAREVAHVVEPPRGEQDRHSQGEGARAENRRDGPSPDSADPSEGAQTDDEQKNARNQPEHECAPAARRRRTNHVEGKLARLVDRRRARRHDLAGELLDGRLERGLFRRQIKNHSSYK